MEQPQKSTPVIGSPQSSLTKFALLFIAVGALKIAVLLGFFSSYIAQFPIIGTVLDWAVSVGAVFGGMRMFPHYKRVLVRY